MRPYVVLSCAMSLDGYIDDASAQRLMLSNDADFDRVDAVRASVDAILVGSGTIRRDNPRLLVRSVDRRASRVAAGQPPTPIKVTLTSTGDLDPGAAFFTAGETEKLVYGLAPGLVDVATVVPVETPIDLAFVLDDLGRRGVRRLLVEGGNQVLTEFLAKGFVDELQLVVAPFFVGDHRAPRFVSDAAFPYTAANRLVLLDATPIGDCVLLRYSPVEVDR